MSGASVGNVARIVAVVAACAAAAGSATSSSSSGVPDPAMTPAGTQGPPPPQQMEASRALGVWRSTFGAVKIEADSSRGGIDQGNVQGVWVYQRQGQEVVGYFAGNLRGNVLQFHWQEPNEPPLTGDGYLVFDPQGKQYSGRWWSEKRDRVGDWSGWRPNGAQQQPNPRDFDDEDNEPRGRNGYRQPPPQRPYSQQPYQQQPYGQPQSNQQPYQQQAPQPAQPKYY